MGNVISVINMKGGVSKTTLTKEVGYFLAKKKSKKVLFIDIDPQSNLTQSFFIKYNLKHSEDLTASNSEFKLISQTIENVFNASDIENIKESDVIYELEENLYIVPGSLSTIFLERATNSSDMEKSIYNFLKKNQIQDKFDYIFIDCPPTYSVYTVAALLPSDFYLTPVEPGVYSILGIKMLNKVVTRIKKTNEIYFEKKPLDNLGVIFTKVENNKNKELIGLILNSNSTDYGYFFKEHFRFSRKLNDKPDYFIADKTDKTLNSNLLKICDELEERINAIRKT